MGWNRTKSVSEKALADGAVDEIGELCDTINYMASELDQAENLKNDFISSVSHELRTPLTAIRGWALTSPMPLPTASSRPSARDIPKAARSKSGKRAKNLCRESGRKCRWNPRTMRRLPVCSIRPARSTATTAPCSRASGSCPTARRESRTENRVPRIIQIRGTYCCLQIYCLAPWSNFSRTFMVTAKQLAMPSSFRLS